MSALTRRRALSRPAGGPVVLVTAVGGAAGAKAAAAALACAASEPDRAALLIDVGDAPPPRPSLIATAGARKLEERLAAHMPEVVVASRGQFCQLTLPVGPRGIEQLPTALPLARESAAAVHLSPPALRSALEDSRIRPTAALLRADLSRDRALTALAVRELIDESLRVAVLKQPLPWLTARAALLGALPGAAGGLPKRLRDRLIEIVDVGRQSGS